jgi:hypothetical protein
MPTTRKHQATNIKTIALAFTIGASAVAIASLAMIDPPSDAVMPVASFDVAPPVVVASPETAQPATATTLLSAASAGGRSSIGRPVARPANDPWSADESSRGTRPDAMH